MKANTGDKIKLIKQVCYGSIHGLIEVEIGTILTVKNRNSSDDGIETEQTKTLNGQLGKVELPIEMWDHEYIIVT